jgi:MFS family permease
MFIGGRAVAGAGGAGIVSGAFSIVAFIAPLKKRPRKNYILTMTSGL